MSLGENSLVAAYQGRGQLKSRPSGTKVGTFIGGQRRWDTKSNKRLTGYTRNDIQRKTVSMNLLLLVWIRYPASQRLIQRQCGLRDSTNETFLCAARDLFGVVVRRKRDFGGRKETLSFVISGVGADSTQ